MSCRKKQSLEKTSQHKSHMSGREKSHKKKHHSKKVICRVRKVVTRKNITAKKSCRIGKKVTEKNITAKKVTILLRKIFNVYKGKMENSYSYAVYHKVSIFCLLLVIFCFFFGGGGSYLEQQVIIIICTFSIVFHLGRNQNQKQKCINSTFCLDKIKTELKEFISEAMP